ncbi:MAG: cysteine desulfurase family protein [Candidatus Pacebacteria bacterium]|nr:cysteine desulfurase family protein [Candidatus Paceibacterota bacterium]MDD5356712.1 cysteine desulfurase family protein [Candidatus Paceibacterota bacterium]
MVKKRIYLDYASTTPLDKEVLRAMRPFFSENFENPSSLYVEGVFAKKAVMEARKIIGHELGVRAEEIIFTSGGTEANNLALLGVFRSAKKKNSRPHIVTTAIEHPSILEVCKQIEREGGEVTYVSVGENGIVNPKDIAKALRKNTVFVSVMYANNEIGTIQPISEIARVIRNFKKATSDKLPATSYPFFHTDASQAANYLPLKVDSLGVSMMTLDGSKIYGPKGVGVLYKRKEVAMEPILFGGGQEGGIRSGTENVPGIVGMGNAVEICGKIRLREFSRLTVLRDFFIAEILKKFQKSSPNGDLEARLPNNINICFPGLDAEFAVIKLDEVGIACASASACNNLSENPSSYVIGALPGKDGCKGSSLRFTLGRGTTKAELDKVLKILPKILN